MGNRCRFSSHRPPEASELRKFPGSYRKNRAASVAIRQGQTRITPREFLKLDGQALQRRLELRQRGRRKRARYEPEGVALPFERRLKEIRNETCHEEFLNWTVFTPGKIPGSQFSHTMRRPV